MLENYHFKYSFFDSFIQKKLPNGENIYYSCLSMGMGRGGSHHSNNQNIKTDGLKPANMLLIDGSHLVLLTKLTK